MCSLKLRSLVPPSKWDYEHLKFLLDLLTMNGTNCPKGNFQPSAFVGILNSRGIDK